VKVKFNRRQEFVVGGFKPNAGGFESLLIGYYQGRKLMFASKVRAGLTPHTRAELFPMLKALDSAESVRSRTSQATRPAIGARASRPKTCRRCGG
jgi:ATP-dependent DNA ligase